ncbi:MAG: DUF294 nucleotidyltransferase-like domain-containing protein [Burkholderiales bacterium]
MSSAAAADSLVNAAIAFLGRYPPFNGMEREALRFLAQRLGLGYYPKDSAILSPAQGEPRFFFIIQRGVVQLAPADSYHLSNDLVTTLGPGECFPVGALLEERPVNSTYIAATDAFCYQLAAADFRELLRRSPHFQHFATDYLTNLLRESRRLLKVHHSSAASEQQAMNRTLRSLIRREAVKCTPQTPIGEALRAMQQEKVGSIVCISPQNAPVGILTRHDVLDRVALTRCDLAAPIASIMTPQPVTLPAEASAYEAALAMARHGIRHIPVVEEGRLIGMVAERDLFALQRVSMRQINRTIADADSLDKLQHAAHDIRQLARDLLEYGVGAEQLTSIISTLNDALTRRIIELEKRHHSLTAIEWCWLAFGSEGRSEQTISSDQDNGLIFNDNIGRPASETRALLLPFAEAVNRTLDACGFPLCKGGIMAGNPHWCLSLGEWQEQFASWVRNTEPEALMHAAIFFDIRALYGSHGLADALRETLRALTRDNARFLRQMAQEALRVRPPLGVLRDFVTDDSKDFPHTLNLKTHGARLFVDAARVLSLAAGTVITGTAQRLREAGAKLNLPQAEISAMVEAFFFIQLLRLRQQITQDREQPHEGHNRIDPDRLNEVDRLILKECFRQARKLQSRLALDYQL